MSQTTVRVASEEPEERLGGFARVRKRSVCASEEAEEAWVASEEPEAGLGGFG